MGEVGKSPHVKSRDQALAIAYSVKRRSRADGGMLPNPQGQGGPLPNAQGPIAGALNFGVGAANANQSVLPTLGQMQPPPGSGGAQGYDRSGMPFSAPQPNAQMGMMPSMQQPGVAMPQAGFAGTAPGNFAQMAQAQLPANWQQQVQQYVAQNPQLAAQMPANWQNNLSNLAQQWWGNPQGMMAQSPNARAFGPNAGAPAPGLPVHAKGGVVKRQIGGQVPWFVRAEARNMLHTGPIPSAVAGRTDQHAISVPSGAYVLPADVVSSLGQGNTHAGFSVLGKMFPSSVPKMGRATIPAPHPMRLAAPRVGMGKLSDVGGARGRNVGAETPILAAGGEFVIHPNDVMARGGGDLKRGHEILDRFVLESRKKHIHTLKGLPGPAKS